MARPPPRRKGTSTWSGRKDRTVGCAGFRPTKLKTTELANDARIWVPLSSNLPTPATVPRFSAELWVPVARVVYRKLLAGRLVGRMPPKTLLPTPATPVLGERPAMNWGPKENRWRVTGRALT